MSKKNSSSVICTSKGSWQKAKQIKRQVRDQSASQHGYTQRNKNLQSIGFKSYAGYLKSDMWRLIREMVFEQKGRVCVSCQGLATQVHHSAYDLKTLLGSSLTHLHPVCRSCHEKAELDEQEKTHRDEVNRRLGVAGMTAGTEGKDRRKIERREIAESSAGSVARSVKRAMRKDYAAGLSMQDVRRKYHLPRNVVRLILGLSVR